MLVAYQALSLAGAPRGTQHQQNRDFGSGIGKHVGGVGHDQLFLSGRLEIDVIDADGKIGDRLYPCRQSSDGFSREFLGMTGQYRIDIFCQTQHFLGVVELVLRIQNRGEIFRQFFLDRIRELAGYQYYRFVTHVFIQEVLPPDGTLPSAPISRDRSQSVRPAWHIGNR